MRSVQQRSPKSSKPTSPGGGSGGRGGRTSRQRGLSPNSIRNFLLQSDNGNRGSSSNSSGGSSNHSNHSISFHRILRFIMAHRQQFFVWIFFLWFFLSFTRSVFRGGATDSSSFGRSSVLDLRSQNEKERDRAMQRVRMRQQQWQQQQAAPPPPTDPPLPKFNYSSPAYKSGYTLQDPQLYVNATDKKSGVNKIDTSVFIIVLSGRENYQRRKAIRETWGQDHALYFVVGGPTQLEQQEIQQHIESNEGNTSSLYRTDTQIQLEKEQTEFHDLLDSIHPDSYQSLPYKVKFSYKWIVEHLPNVQWIVKVDDDTVVRVDTLRTAFLKNFNWHIPMVVGRIIERSGVARTGKWAEPNYAPDYYPYWPQGSCGHVVSRSVAQYIADLHNPTYYQGEDVSIGIWLDEAPDANNFHVTWVHSEYFRNDRKCLDHAWLIMGHEVTEDEMRKCYTEADEWPIEDVQHHHRRYWKIETLQQRKELGVPSWYQ